MSEAQQPLTTAELIPGPLVAVSSTVHPSDGMDVIDSVYVQRTVMPHPCDKCPECASSWALSKLFVDAFSSELSEAYWSTAIPAASEAAILTKTKACRHYARGHCALGDDCNFAHSPAELRVKPTNICKTKMCDRGRSCRRVNCGYAHSEAELFSYDDAAMDEEMQQSSYVQYIEQMALLLSQEDMSAQSD
ncbi:hypothetical protein FOL47_011000 [Perkinsus chesapeaki]|uniref:C3H1-type domain-containing protein n=1 Tax=Perkinsus chesapeaki TaxID=330153 RepID=A0A7J6L1C6_PERCH|nr:hypothetical protein FOL47_011000 [Perkinsus chesapeaki]